MLKDDRELEPAAFLFVFGEDENEHIGKRKDSQIIAVFRKHILMCEYSNYYV